MATKITADDIEEILKLMRASKQILWREVTTKLPEYLPDERSSVTSAIRNTIQELEDIDEYIGNAMAHLDRLLDVGIVR